MNIVLATAPIPDLKGNAGSFPPLGLMYLAGSVKNLPGVQVSLVDAANEGLTAEETAARILALSPDLIGISVGSCGVRHTPALLASLKAARKDALTIGGGVHATVFDHLMLKEIPTLDFVLRGEADESFPELCRRLMAGKKITGIAGLSHRARGKIVRGELQLVQNLDAMPFPDRDILERYKYGIQFFGFVLPKLPKFTTAYSSRGCPYRCTFCAGTLYGRLRTRSARNVFQELQELYGNGYRTVIFCDDNFTGDVARVDELCRIILEHKLEMHLGCVGTLHNVPDETLNLMHEAGFALIYVGAESGSDAQLRRFKKPTKSEWLAGDIRRAKKAHLFTIASFITGEQGETPSDHEASKALVRKVRPHVCEIGPLMLFPGSQLWRDITGPGEPDRLEDTVIRMVSSFKGQLSKETIRARQRDFRETFKKTWLDWRRIFDIIDLLVYNKLFKGFIKEALLNPKIWLQLYRTSR
jgi:anaerobic magnesium-protoporphyrin IX monomethyl ester cyclase